MRKQAAPHRGSYRCGSAGVHRTDLTVAGYLLQRGCRRRGEPGNAARTFGELLLAALQTPNCFLIDDQISERPVISRSSRAVVVVTSHQRNPGAFVCGHALLYAWLATFCVGGLLQLGETWDVVVAGSGNAALCAAISAADQGARVLVLEKSSPELAGGNSTYTAGAMRFAYRNRDELMPLLRHCSDPRIAAADFGSYASEQFKADLLSFNGGRALSWEQETLVDRSYSTMLWLAEHGVPFEPIFSRQSFEREGVHVFWGGLTLASRDEGVGLVESEMSALRELGGQIRFDSEVTEVHASADGVNGVTVSKETGERERIDCRSLVLACGGFESNREMRERHLGKAWGRAKVRGTPHNMGGGLELALSLGACKHGLFAGCHATPMDYYTPDYGNLSLPPGERKHYRKICYFLGIMINSQGRRFVDEGSNFRNYTYAQFGREIMRQPGHVAWQVFDSKVFDLLYSEYSFKHASYVEANSIESLTAQMGHLTDAEIALATIRAFNDAVDDGTQFNPSTLDGKGATGLTPPKSNWAQKIDTAPFRAYPVTGGITFTFGGVEISDRGAVRHESGGEIPGLFACGEIVGGVFFDGYPGGSGLTSGAVFGRIAGEGAADFALQG